MCYNRIAFFTVLCLQNAVLQIYRRRCPDIRIETELFSDAAPLLQQIRREEPADIYILDILLSDLTGIALRIPTGKIRFE